MTFDQLGLSDLTLQAINDLGYTQPTPVQEQAIPVLLGNNSDVVALAQTGTGKTAAFGLPLVDMIEPDLKKPQGLVICPTRELCLQISRDLQGFSAYRKGMHILAVYGGSSMDTQIRALKRGVSIVVATPGRLKDLMERGVVDISEVRTVVLDEADEMLNMGFQEDIDHILSFTPNSRKTWLFSATMPKEVERIAMTYMSDPVQIAVGKRNAGATTVEHIVYCLKEKDRYTALRRLLDFHPDIFGLVFCRTRNETQTVADKLQVDGYNALPLHGDMSQQQRDSAMKKFRDRTIQVLVATDVAARGIDVDNISHVINYNLPDDIENYTHRSGRTGRAGRTGESLVLINQREVYKIRGIEKQMNIVFKYGRVPSAEQIIERQLLRFVSRIAETPVHEEDVERYLSRAWSVFGDMTREELIMKVIAAEIAHFQDRYRFAGDINIDLRPKKEHGKDRSGNRDDGRDGGRKNRNLKGSPVRFFMSAGELDNMNKGGLVRLICSSAGIESASIGRIDIHDKFSFFEVSEDAARSVKNASTSNLRYGNLDVRIEQSDARPDDKWKYKKNKGGGASKRSSDNRRERRRRG